jgi:hypothetical protein
VGGQVGEPSGQAQLPAVDVVAFQLWADLANPDLFEEPVGNERLPSGPIQERRPPDAPSGHGVSLAADGHFVEGDSCRCASAFPCLCWEKG